MEESNAEIATINREIAELMQAEVDFDTNLGNVEILSNLSPLNEHNVLDTKGNFSNSCQDVNDGASVTLSLLQTCGEPFENEKPTETLDVSLALNRKLRNQITGCLDKISVALEQNRHQQERLRNDFDDVDLDAIGATRRRASSLYCKPFFKDFRGSFPSQNFETLKKKASGKIAAYVKRQKPWAPEEMNVLTNSVRADCLQRNLRPFMNRKEIEFRKLKDVNEGSEEEKELLSIMKSLDKSMLAIKDSSDFSIVYGRPEDSKDIDWSKIANIDLKCQRSEGDCRNIWMNIVHPTINKQKWTREEDAKLVELAERFQHTRWKEISQLLATNRSPFMCLQRFQTKFNPLLHSKWTSMEDRILERNVKKFVERSQDVPWCRVAKNVKTRSAAECQYRWKKLGPTATNKKKWDKKLDEMLVQAVEIFGCNWSRVAFFIPGKSSAQCRDRYANSLDESVRSGKWSREEDTILWKAVREFGLVGKWSKISQEHLPNRTDNQILLRYKRLLKYEAMEKEVRKKDDDDTNEEGCDNDVHRLKLPEKPDYSNNTFTTKTKSRRCKDKDEFHVSRISPSVPNSYGLRKRRKENRMLSSYDDDDDDCSSGGSDSGVSSGSLERPTKRQRLETLRGNVNSNNAELTLTSHISAKENIKKVKNGRKSKNSGNVRSVDEKIITLLSRSNRRGDFINEFKSKQQSKADFSVEVEEKVVKLLENALQLMSTQAAAAASKVPLLPPCRSSLSAFSRLMNCRNDLVQAAKLFQFPKKVNLPKPWQRTQLEKFVESSRVCGGICVEDSGTRPTLGGESTFDDNFVDGDDATAISHVRELLTSTTNSNTSPDEIVLKHSQASRLCRSIKSSEEYSRLRSKFTSLFFWPVLLNYSIDDGNAV